MRITCHLLLILLCQALVSPTVSIGQSPYPTSASPPNILIIVADDLGYGDLGCTGHTKIKTPNLDQLARDGATFTNFYAAASVCSPSRAAMLTGRMPYRLGIYGFIHTGDPYVHLPRGEVTLPQLFRKAGYQTLLIGKWHVSSHDFRAEFPHIPSMDDYGLDYWFSSDNNTVILNKPGWWRNGESLGKIDGYAANVVGDATIHWLEQERDAARPFLAFVHFYEPHWLVEAPRKLVDGYLQGATSNENEAIYFAAVENVDQEVGRILAVLKEQGLADNTLVMFTSDHGPAKLGKQRNNFRSYGTAKPYRGNKYGLWDGSVHVPGILSWPAGGVSTNSTIEAPCGSIDWLPTLCELAGVEIPGGLELDGESFAPALAGEDWRRTAPLQWHHYNATLKTSPNPNAVMRDDDLVVVGHYDQPPQGKGRWIRAHMPFIRHTPLVRFELYDLATDPQQLTDISTARPEVFAELKRRLRGSHTSLQSSAVGWEGGVPSHVEASSPPAQ